MLLHHVIRLHLLFFIVLMIERPVEAEITFCAFKETRANRQKTKQIKKLFDNTCAAFIKHTRAAIQMAVCLQ